MHRSMNMIAGAVMALALTGCGTVFSSIFGSTATAPQANSVYAAEGFYVAGDKVTTAAINNGVVTSAETVQAIQKDDNAVYAELVSLRTAAESGKSVVTQAALDAFNLAFAKLFTDAASGGVKITIPAQYLQPNGGAQ